MRKQPQAAESKKIRENFNKRYTTAFQLYFKVTVTTIQHKATLEAFTNSHNNIDGGRPVAVQNKMIVEKKIIG